jgi:hypothetical protein
MRQELHRAIITLTLYSLSRTFLPIWLSFTVGFAFLVRAFHHDIFNYVLPYSYPAAYGAMFSTVLLWLLVQDCFEERRWRILAAGWIACLTLPSRRSNLVFLPTASLLALIAIRAAHARTTRKIVRDAVACAPGILLCTGIYGVLVIKSSFSFIFEETSPSPNSYFVSVFGKRWLHQLVLQQTRIS